jgi:HAD superfamily hydrolase (TIGR01450 family)
MLRALSSRRCGFVLDLDGCLVLRDDSHETAGRLLPGAPELLVELREQGLPFVCCTNAAGKPPGEYAKGLRALGLQIADDELITPAVVAAEHLTRGVNEPRVMVAAGRGVTEPLFAAGIKIVPPDAGEHADVVLVGPASELSARTLQVAAETITAGAAFLVTSYVPLIPKGSGHVASVSAGFAAAIAHVSGTTPTVVGKPSPLVMEAVSRRMQLDPSEVVIVGDDLTLEIELGRRTGSLTVLVLTGITGAADLEGLRPELRPDIVLRDVEELCALIKRPAA